MREQGYILLTVMVFISILSLSCLAIVTTLMNDRVVLSHRVDEAKSEGIIFKNLKLIEDEMPLLAGCKVSFLSPYNFSVQTENWWRVNACTLQTNLQGVLAEGELDAHRYILVQGLPKRARQQMIVLRANKQVWVSFWLVASDDAAVLDHESVLSVAEREQLEYVSG